MKFFIDTAKVEDIKKASDMGVICGVTTNPSLIAKEGRVFEEVIREITAIVDGPISGEVKEVVEEAECGKCTISGNAEELAHLIEHYYQNADLLKQWGENGLKYYQKHFEKEKCISDLEKIFGDIIGKKKESYAKTR